MTNEPDSCLCVTWKPVRLYLRSSSLVVHLGRRCQMALTIFSAMVGDQTSSGLSPWIHLMVMIFNRGPVEASSDSTSLAEASGASRRKTGINGARSSPLLTKQRRIPYKFPRNGLTPSSVGQTRRNHFLGTGESSYPDPNEDCHAHKTNWEFGNQGFRIAAVATGKLSILASGRSVDCDPEVHFRIRCGFSPLDLVRTRYSCFRT